MKPDLITSEQAERRDLFPHGTGALQFHITLWGDSALKVQIAMRADDQATAEKAALDWGRHQWWKDERKIGIALVERVMTPAEEAEILIQAEQRGFGQLPNAL